MCFDVNIKDEIGLSQVFIREARFFFVGSQTKLVNKTNEAVFYLKIPNSNCSPHYVNL